jgi:hypothetical protein
MEIDREGKARRDMEREKDEQTGRYVAHVRRLREREKVGRERDRKSWQINKERNG